MFASGIEIARLELTDEVLRYSVCETIENLNGAPLEQACIEFLSACDSETLTALIG
jgi:hypothetical protein|tara:strand:+ start:797 stop:964 length:168 start_codon:yes stop_codon:yes gene_type:complete